MTTHPHARAAIALLATEAHLGTVEHALMALAYGETTQENPLVVWLDGLDRGAVLAATATAAGLELVDLFAPGAGLLRDPGLLAGVDVAWLENIAAVPMIEEATGDVVVACANPLAHAAADLLKTFGATRLLLAEATQVRNTLGQLSSALLTTTLEGDLSPEESAEAVVEALAVPAVSEGTVKQWLRATLHNAAASGASDLHFEKTTEGRLWLRFRIDGTLVPQRATLPGQEDEILAALMTEAGMDAANRRTPQDGRFAMIVSGRKVDARVSMLPLVGSRPKIVVRLLDSANINRSLDDMGLRPDVLALLRTHLSAPQGSILVAGPTGSGKTSTLYGALREIARPEINVATVEDPVEYKLAYASQTEVSPAAGMRSLTFPNALRAILRQDPDVILVGEIRDEETARVATQASMTGHLVLSTIHANTATGIVTRLADMGLKRYLVADSISLLLSQRLVKLVHDCATMRPVTEAEAVWLAEFGAEDIIEVPAVTGCGGCSSTGTRGRTPVLEALEPSRALRRLISDETTTEGDFEDLIARGQAGRHVPMATSVAALLRERRITLEEGRRVLFHP